LSANWSESSPDWTPKRTCPGGQHPYILVISTSVNNKANINIE